MTIETVHRTLRVLAGIPFVILSTLMVLVAIIEIPLWVIGWNFKNTKVISEHLSSLFSFISEG